MDQDLSYSPSVFNVQRQTLSPALPVTLFGL